MSVVKIQGNVSGTGAFTIAAPNSNNNRTMTLADTDGTIYIAPGNGIQVLAAGVPVARTLTAGTGITITNGDGSAGNPTIAATATAPTTAQVLSATAGLTAGDVGSYGFFYQTTASTFTAGSTTSGSNLRWMGVGVFGGYGSSGTPAGTWRCLGYADASNQATLWLRIS